MKKCIYLLALLFVCFFSSCEKFPDNLNVTINQAGTVTVKVVDKDGKPLQGAEVYVGGLEKGLSDSEGIFISQKLLQNTYDCGVIYKKGKFTYKDEVPLQIIANENKSIILNPMSNVGSLDIQLINAVVNSPYPTHEPYNVDVALLPSYPDYSLSVDMIPEVAFLITKSNSQNKVTFSDLPAHTYYKVIVYDKDSKKIFNTGGSFYVERNEMTNIFVYFDRYN